MRSLAIYLFATCIFSSIFGQSLSIQWQECFGGSDRDQANDIIYDDNGDIYMLGQTYSIDGDISFSYGLGDVWLIKTNSEGEMIWQKSYGGSSWEGGYKIFSSEDGIILINITSSKDGDISHSQYDISNFWITKINTSGSIIWDSIYGGNGMDEIRNATKTKDGGFLITGLTTSDDGNISQNYGYWDVWVFKIDQDGILEWEKTFGTIDLDEAGQIIETIDSGYIIAMSSLKDSSGNCYCQHHYTGYSDFWIVKLDSLRNIIWQKCYGGKYYEISRSILEIYDGYIILGITNSNDGDVSGFHGVPGDPNFYDIWLLKIDKQGEIIWQKCLGGSKHENAFKIELTQDSTYMIFGDTESGDGDVIGHHTINGIHITKDIWMVEVDQEGEIIWQQCIGGSQDDYIIYGAVHKSLNNYIIAGNSDRPADGDVQCEFHGGYMPDFWVFELNDSATGISDMVFDKIKIIAYPNPAEDHIVFEWPENTEIRCLKIYDLYGKQLEQLSPGLKQSNIQWNCSHISRGIYFFRAETHDRVFCDKFFVQ